ncbi:MAG: LamG domain-containing protein [SAR202 cluster bacterium]|nr:LamG domain-containing protein [SAR202 cluster bacterium]
MMGRAAPRRRTFSMKLTGYTDRLSVRPGEAVRFMVSSQPRTYHAEIVRVIHGDPNPKGPGLKVEKVRSSVSGDYKGRVQHIRGGSYVSVPDSSLLQLDSGFTIQAWVQPTAPDNGVQGLVARWAQPGGGYGLFVDEGGELALWLGDGKRVERVRSGVALMKGEWCFVAATWDRESGVARVYQHPLGWTRQNAGAAVERRTRAKPAHPQAVPLLIAAGWQAKEAGKTVVSAHYNGKLDSPRLFNRALESDEIAALRADAPPSAFAGAQVAVWDFSQEITSSRAVDASQNRLHGAVVNMPMRAVTGHNWTGKEHDFKRAPQQYGAIHFHDDDIDDARWDVDFEWKVPEKTRSGFYSAHITSGEHHDLIPFIVRPKIGKPTGRVGYLASTNTYLAYGNEHVEIVTPEWIPNAKMHLHQDERRYVIENGLNSMYDLHRDGSGVAYATRRVPILNIRPDYTQPVRGSPHALPADLYLTDWMEQKGFDYDVFTDEDLHFDGLALLSQYKVVVTGSHPEYWSGPMLDALEAYLVNGGRLMYLGGNGFYWVTSFDPERPWVIEIRRWGGTESWKAGPGEFHHSTTGEMGGLWRKQGRAPQKLAGVGFTAQGFDRNEAYKRKPGSFDPRAAFIFKGIGKDEIIGNFDSLLINWGAAGDEIDRYDLALGTPPHTLLLATSFGHSDAYLLVIEEVGITMPGLGGTTNPLVHSDLAYLETPKGGGVFSVGSISWMGSLSYNGYDNNVSRITENVMRRFISDEPLPDMPK